MPEDRLPAHLDGVRTFAELVAALYSARYTGVVQVHLCGGQVQQAEVGRPHVLVFAKPGPVSTNPLDTTPASAPSSTPVASHGRG